MKMSSPLKLALTALIALGIGGVPVATSAHGPENTLVVPTKKDQKARPTIEVAFVLDTTGSMSGLIEGAKRKIWSIASRIATGTPTPRLRVALVGYRDKGDAYVTKRFDLTDNLDEVYENLQSFRADGGGDTPEHVGRALGEAVKHFSWSSNRKTLKMIFLVGDAPPQTYQDGWNYVSWAKKAIANDIIVNTVRCGGMAETAKTFQEIADLADGQFISIDGGGGMIAVTTPFDADIAKVSSDIASSSVYVGEERARRAATVASAAVAEMDAPAAADRAGYMTKSSGGVAGSISTSTPAKRGVKDVIAMSDDELKRADESKLPASLRGLGKRERVAKVKVMKAERVAQEKKLLELSKKRDAYIAEHASEKEDSFDGAVMKEVRSKAARIGVTYK